MIPEPHTPVTWTSAEARLVRPRVAADDLHTRLERLRVDPDPLDGSGCGALAAADLRSLEGGPGRARGGDQPLAVPEDDLGVRADVHDEADLVGEMRRLGEDHSRRVGTDVPGDAGQDVRARPRVDGQPELGCVEAEPRVERERERSAAELGRVDAEEQVVHDGIPHEGDLEHVRPLDARVPAQLGRQLREAAADGTGELLLRAGVEHHVRHAAHEVLAEADLRVHLPGRRDDLAGVEVAEMAGDRRRPDVERDAERHVVEARPDCGDDRPVVHRHGDPPPAAS